MKQAILINAYRDFEHLESIVRFFDEQFLIFIHVDKKTRIPPFVMTRLMNFPHVAGVWQQYKVNWGDIAYLKVALFLCRQALRYPEIAYVHHISGQDFPVKSCSGFKAFFEGNTTNYIQAQPFPYEGWNECETEGGLGRLQYWYLLGIWNVKKGHRFQQFNRFMRWQKKLGFRRRIPHWLPQLHGGSAFWSLTRPCASYLVQYAETHPRVFRWFRFTFCPEEIYVPTVLMQSPFRNTINGDNLRYIDWGERNGNSPANLDESDYAEIMASTAFFARKFVSPYGDKLKKRLLETLQPQPADQNVFAVSGS